MILFKKLFSHIKASKDLITIFVGDFISKGFTFFVNIILLKVAAPDDFGLFAVYITYLGLGAKFADFGINQGIVKFFSFYKIDNLSKADAFINLGFIVKIVVAITLSAFYYLLAYPTSTVMYEQSSLLLPLTIAAIGVFGTTLLEYIQSVLQARQKYSRLAFIKMLEGFLKLGGIIFLVFLREFSITLVYWIYAIVPVFIFFIGVNNVKLDKTIPERKVIISELFNFSKWIFLSSLVTMLLDRLDILMLSFLKSGDYNGLGIYSAGLKLGVPLIVATGSMVTVFYPKAMEIRTIPEVKKYIRKTLKTTIPLSFLFLLFWISIEIVVPAYLSSYTASLHVFRVLLFAYMILLLVNPINLLMYTINKQKLVLYINIFQLVLNIFLNCILFVHYDIVGVAIGTLITYLMGGIINFVYLYKYIKLNQQIMNRTHEQ